MHFQLTHQAERSWAMILTQVEQNRLETAHPGAIEKMKPLDKRINPQRRRSNQPK